jgi:hypothetical protein
MSSIYMNDFDDPTYQFKLLEPTRIERLLTGFEAAYSQVLFCIPARGRFTVFLSASVPCYRERTLRPTCQP